MNQQIEGMTADNPEPSRHHKEVRRAILRMTTNYIRLFLSVFIGLMLVRIIITHWDNDAWALIAFLGGTLGLAAMIQDVVRQSMIRELADAHHSGDPARFLSIYNSSLIVTFGVGVITFIVVIIFAFLLPLFNIPEDMLEVARWLLIAKGIETVVAVFVGAPMNMYIATERMLLSNFWIVAQRTCPIIAALWIIFVQGIEDPVQGLKNYAILSASMFILVKLLGVGLMIFLDRRMIPRPTKVTRSAMKEILHIGGWNAVAVTSLGMHLRIDAILMNLFFGLGGNLIFGFTSQLTSYVRMLAMGVSYGLDAVTTRINISQGDQAVRTLCHHITRLNSCIAFPSAAGLFILAEPILYFWVGDRMTDPETQLTLTIVLIRVMTVGMVIRAMTDGWIKIMYGAGYVRKYAPLILGGVIANPILAIALYFVLPESCKFIFAVLAYSSVYLIINLGLLPRLIGKLLGGSTFSILSPTIKPMIITLLSAGALYFATSFVVEWSVWNILFLSGGYGALYLVLAYLTVLNTNERSMVLKQLKKVIPIA